MKKNICAIVALLWAGAAYAAEVTLEAAIKQTADELGTALPAGQRIIITKFDSEAPELSAYIIDELTGALVRGGKLKVVTDRTNLEYIQKELRHQESGAVSAETAQSIGKQMGAQTLLLGSLVKRDKSRRWQVTAVGIESALNEAAVPLDVRDYGKLLAALKSGKTQADMSYLDLQVKQTPQTAADFVNRGLIFAKRGDFDTAILDFDDAVKHDPKYVLAYLQRGKLLFARQQKFGLEIDSDFELSWVGITRNKTADDDRALNDLSKAISLDVQLGSAYFYRAAMYTIIKEYDKAIIDCTQALRIDPNSTDMYITRGHIYSEKGDFDRGIIDYNQAIKLDPNYANAYTSRGAAYKSNGDFDKAITDYNQAIKLGSNDATVYNNRGAAYSEKGDYSRGIVDYNQAIKLDPNYTTAYNNRGTAYTSKGDFDKAIDDFNRAIKLDLNNAEAYGKRGLAYFYKNNYNKSIADYTQAIKLNPNFTWAYASRSNAYISKGDYDKAIVDCTHLIKLDPEYAIAYIMRGMAYEAKGEYVKSRADYAMFENLK